MAKTSGRAPASARPGPSGWGSAIDPELRSTALRMLAYFAAFVVLTMLVMPASLRLAIQEATAIVSGQLIGLAGIDVSREGTLLLLPGITLAVDWACTAIIVVTLYASLLLAHRASVAHKVLGLTVGLAVLLVANQLRILATALAAEYAPYVLYIAHDYLFQVGMVVVAVALWIWWLNLVNRDGGRDG